MTKQLPLLLLLVFSAIVTNHLSAGLSAKVSQTLRLNAAYEYALKNNETATANSYVAREYNNSTSGLENHIYHVSLSWVIK